jgi:microcystin-dependent protein
MSQPFIGEIRMFGGNFNPRGWALCDGALLQINQNSALFSILGTFYGGDGRTTFALPDLRGRVPLSSGQGPGLSNRAIGSRSGAETVSLASSTNPSHTHTPTAKAHAAGADSTDPTDASLAVTPGYSTAGANTMMGSSSAMVGTAGSSSAHNNVQPFQVVNYIIALQGLFPSRN